MNKQKVAVVTACACCLTLVGGVQADSLADWEAAVGAAQPLHWYRFNETTGTSCVDSGSGKLNGTYDGPMPGQVGLFNSTSAAVFNRTLGADRTNFPGATNLANSWTAEYVVMSTRMIAPSNDAMALHDSDTTSIRLACWTLLGEVGLTLYDIADYRFTPSAGHAAQDLIAPLNEWIHLVFRRDRFTTQVFVNGELIGTSPNSVDLPRLRISGRGGIHTDALDCVLDEAVVYGRALSNEDILAHAKIVATAATGAANANPPTSANVLVLVESPDLAAGINGCRGGIATLLSDGEATGLTVARITTAGGWPWAYHGLNPAPPAGRYRLTLRARMASSQGQAVSVSMRGSDDSFYYRATGVLDFSDVSPAAGFVERSCDLDLLKPVDTSGYLIQIFFADNMDVDWYMLESLPGGNSPPVEVVQAQTEKLFYKSDADAVAMIRLLNTSSTWQVTRLRIRLESALADSRVVWDASLVVPASGIPELFTFPLGRLAAGGTAVIAEILDGNQQVVSTIRDYTLSGDSPVDVSPLFDNFIGQRLPPYNPDDAAIEIQPSRLKYAALTELNFWAPCDTTMLTAPPGRTTWWSGQTLKRFSVEQLQAYTQFAETQGIGVVAYVDYSITFGWRVLEAARKQPDILEWDASGAGDPLFVFHMGADGAASVNSRQRREDESEWAANSADGVARVIMSSPAMLKLHTDQLVASMKQFGWSGFRYDDPLAYDADQVDVFGRQAPFDGWTNEAMIRYIRDRITAENPDAVYGRNADAMRTVAGYSDAEGKATQSETEAAIVRGKGGFLLQEAFSAYIFRTKSTYEDIRDYYVTGGRNAKAAGGHIFAIVDMSAAANDDEREYVGALAGAAGVQLAYQASTTPYMQFLARYAGLLFGKRVQPVQTPTSLVKVDAAGRDVWWSDYVYCHYVGAGRRQYLVHLVNPPATANVADTMDSPEPVALTKVVVSFTLPVGWNGTNATLLTPDGQARGRFFFEGADPAAGTAYGYNIITEPSMKMPIAQPLPLAGGSVTVPQVAKWSIVVLDCTGPANDLPDGPVSTLPALPPVPDVNLAPVATPVTSDSLAEYCEPFSTHPNAADTPNSASRIIADSNARGGTALLIKTNMVAGETVQIGFGRLYRAGAYKFTVRIRTETDDVRDLYLRVWNDSREPVPYRIDVPLGTQMLKTYNGYREFSITAHLGEAAARGSVGGALDNIWPGLVVDYVRGEPLTLDTDSNRLPLRGEVAWPGSANVPNYVWRQAPRVWFANGLYHEYFGIKEALQAVAPAAEISFGDPYLYGSDNRGWNGKPFPGTPAELMGNNLVVLADIPANNNIWPTSSSNGLAWLDWLRGYVGKGGRVLLTGGPFGFGRGAWNSDLIQPMLPVTLAPRTVTGLGYDLHPVPGGAAPLQPSGPLADGLDWSTPAQVFWLHQATVRAGAVVQAAAGDLPVIVTGTYGAGRVAVVLAAPLGKPPAGQTAFWDAPQWGPLMSNVVDWLLTPDAPGGPGGSSAVNDAMEDFEQGQLGTGWSSAGDSLWYVTSEACHAGRFSARAGAVGDAQTTTLTLRANAGEGQISFWRRVSSERGFDVYRFWIDGKLREEVSGEYVWAEVSFPIGTGSHTFVWEYSKDDASSSGSDTVYIDDVRLPAAN